MCIRDRFQLICPQNGSAVLKLPHTNSKYFVPKNGSAVLKRLKTRFPSQIARTFIAGLPKHVFLQSALLFATNPTPHFAAHPSCRYATRLTPYGASRLLQATPAWSVKTRRAPSRHCRDARVYGHATTAMHDICLLYTSPSPRDLSTSRMPSSA